MKAYTNFGFHGYAITEYHCTHAYLDEVNTTDLERIEEVIKNYFEKVPLKEQFFMFIEEDYFGPNNDIRVLKLANHYECNLHLPLRKKIECNLKYPAYIPHITNPTVNYLGATIDRYSLVVKEDGKVRERLIIKAE